MVSKDFKKINFFAQTQKENLVKNRLIIRIRNFAPLNEPLIILKKIFYHEVTDTG